jgi:hypothetical protein
MQLLDLVGENYSSEEDNREDDEEGEELEL